MINFDQSAAWNFYTALNESPDDTGKIETMFQIVVASSGANAVDRAIKNCQCPQGSYNSKDLIINRLWHVLHAMSTVSADEVFGYLIPEFFCLGQKAVDLSKTDGKVSSESFYESTTKKPRRS